MNIKNKIQKMLNENKNEHIGLLELLKVGDPVRLTNNEIGIVKSAKIVPAVPSGNIALHNILVLYKGKNSKVPTKNGVSIKTIWTPVKRKPVNINYTGIYKISKVEFDKIKKGVKMKFKELITESKNHLPTNILPVVSKNISTLNNKTIKVVKLLKDKLKLKDNDIRFVGLNIESTSKPMEEIRLQLEIPKFTNSDFSQFTGTEDMKVNNKFSLDLMKKLTNLQTSWLSPLGSIYINLLHI